MISVTAKHLSLFIAAALTAVAAMTLPVLILMSRAVHEQGPLRVLNENIADFSLSGVVLLVLINGAMQVAAFFFLRKHQTLVFIAAVFAVWSAFLVGVAYTSRLKL